MVPAAQRPELVLPAPGPRVLRDVPSILDRDAVALGRAPLLPQGLRAPAHHLLEPLLAHGLALGARAQTHPAHDQAREVAHALRRGLRARDGGAQGGDAAPDVVADRAHAQPDAA